MRDSIGQRPRLALLVGLATLVVAAAGCARVHPHVSLPTLALGEPSFFPTLEAYTGSPIVSGNRVEILLNGEAIFPAMIEAISSARRTITYAQYYYEDGLVARVIAATLADRCRAGVKASILLDAFGSSSMPPQYAELMKAGGCQLVYFRPLDPFRVGRANNRNHRRILVVDGRVGFTGGAGVSRKWMGNGRMEDHWRDTDVRVEGPVVQYLQAAFAENWLEATGIVLGGEDYFPRPIRPQGQVHAQVVRSSPSAGGFAMYTTFLLAISSARQRIYITNPYFVPDRKMTEALVQAAGRGVRVMVLVPGVIDNNLVRHAGRRQFGRLLIAGVEIHEYTAALLHSKTMVIDGVWTTIGTTNLDNRSFALNDEINLVLYDATVGRRLERVFTDDLAYSRKVEYREWRRRGVRARLMEILAIPLHDLL